jgi:NitT/TauT family transport system substrate-binding protein
VKNLSIRRLLVLGLASLAAAPALALDKASLRLNWVLIGQHPAYYLGLERGYYRDEGIDLTINEGRGSGPAVQLVAGGEDTFGLADTGAVIAGRAKGAPVKVIMSLFRTSNLSVTCAADANVRTLTDLYGKKVAVTAGDALHQMWPGLVGANNLDEKKITLVFMDPAAKPVAVLQGRTECLLGGIDDQAVTIASQGKKIDVLRFADNKFNTLTVSAFTSDKVLAEKPDLVRRFARATERSWKAAMADPDAAIKAAAKAKPGINESVLRAQMEASFKLIPPPDGSPMPFGIAPESYWEQTIAILTRYQGLKTEAKVADHFDYRWAATK